MSFLSNILETCLRHHSADEIARELHHAIMGRPLITDPDKAVALAMWEAAQKHKRITDLESVDRSEPL